MKKELIAYNEPKSPITENFKILRTNLQFMNVNKKIQSVLITSTLPGEGKSWSAANLAITFAQAGQKVVILDADMRKGRQFNMFEVSPRPGLSNYLSGVINNKNNIDPNEIRNFIKETQIDNVYLIPAGDVPPNPSELLVTSKMINLIEELKTIFDIVIIDTPPALLVTDAKILSRLADISLIVAEHKKTKIDNLRKIKKEIQNIGGKVGGVILNKMELQTKKYEGSYYYGENSMTVTNNTFTKFKKTALDDRNESGIVTKKVQESNNKAQNSDLRGINNNITERDGVREILNNNEVTIDKTQDILRQINSYLEDEKRKMSNGD